MGVRAAAGVCEQMEAGVLDDDSALEQVGQGPADLVHALAVEDELGEPAVDLDRALQPPVLGVDDAFEQRRHQVDELDVGRDREEGHLQAVGLGDHLGRQPPQVGQGADDQAGPAAFGDPADQPDLGIEVVFDREAAREHEVAGARLDLGRLHQTHPFDLAVEAVGPGHELGRSKHGSHCLAHRRPRRLGLRLDPFGGHQGKLRVCIGDKQDAVRVVGGALGGVQL